MKSFWKSLRELDRAAAMDSARNVLMTVGAGSLLADFATMQKLYALPCAGIAILIWWIDYMRHF